MTRRGLDGKINRNRALFDAEPFAALGRAEQRERPEQEEAEHAETKSKVFFRRLVSGVRVFVFRCFVFSFFGEKIFFCPAAGR